MHWLFEFLKCRVVWSIEKQNNRRYIGDVYRVSFLFCMYKQSLLVYLNTEVYFNCLSFIFNCGIITSDVGELLCKIIGLKSVNDVLY